MKPILFLLPVKGGSGGAHSVMQEAETMASFGIPVYIACNLANVPFLRDNYRDLTNIYENIFPYNNVESLNNLIADLSPEICVATTNQSVHVLASAVKAIPNIKTAYYVQDYEPFFYDPESDEWRMAYSSYGLIPGMVHFAKTKWLQEVVLENHGVSVAKVLPSVDHSIYKPNFKSTDAFGSQTRIVKIIAMLRPMTPRRAPKRTVRILNEIAARYGKRISISAFGCANDELSANHLELNPDVQFLGILSRIEVAELFQQSDLFLDLSDFQAFGRTAIEAMGCGAVSIVPMHGGVHEYAINGVNSFIVDTRLDRTIFEAVEAYLTMKVHEKVTMRLNAIATSYRYDLGSAVLSEIAVLTGC